MTNRTKSEFTSHRQISAKTNFWCCCSHPVSRMLATVLEWLTDFLTGAIMESRKAARSKAVASPPCLTHWTLRSKFEFSFVAPIHFLQKKWGEVDKISRKFILYDYFRNSHDHCVLQSIDIIRRNLMLITLRAYRVNRPNHISKSK